MDEQLEIMVVQDGTEKAIPVALKPYGYTYRLTAMVNETEIIYEPDEEGGYRVIVNEHADKLSPADKQLIDLIRIQLNALRD